jgi:hypothetical protein
MQEQTEEREHHHKDRDRDNSAQHALSLSEVDDRFAAPPLPGNSGSLPRRFPECRIMKASTAIAATVSLPAQQTLEPIAPA